MKIRIAILGISLLFLFNNCSTDIDLNNEWKEIFVIYGLVDKADSVHTIRIEKAFLSESNAIEQSLTGDSIYHPNNLQVTVQESGSGRIFNFTKVDGNDPAINLPKEVSIDENGDTVGFSYDPNVLYQSQFNLDSTRTYSLRVENPSTGNVVTASTGIVNTFRIVNPRTSFPFSFSPERDVQWKSAENGKIYGLTIRFYYDEWTRLDATKNRKFIDWPVFGNEIAGTSDGNESMSYPLKASGFYAYLAANLVVDENIIREVADPAMDFLFYSGSEDLFDYVRVNRAQSGLTQLEAKPVFTNLEGEAVGLFSSRLTQRLIGVQLAPFMIDEIACDDVTTDLNFLDKVGDDCN